MQRQWYMTWHSSANSQHKEMWCFFSNWWDGKANFFLKWAWETILNGCQISSSGSRQLDGIFSNSVFACCQCFSFESILLSDISDVTYRNIFPLVLRYLLLKFACWLHYAILTAFFGTSQLFCSVFQLRGFKVVLFYFWSSCDYQVLC